MPKSGPIDGAGITMTLIGSVLVYAGIKGYSVLAILENLITGKPIATGVTVTNAVNAPNAPITTAPPLGPTKSKPSVS